METETTISKDGSGEKSFKMDMSSMGMLMGMMKGVEEESTDEEKEDIISKNIEESLNQEGIEKLMDGEAKEFNLSDLISNPGAMGDIDTSFNVYDVMPDSIKSNEGSEFMKKVHMSIKSDEESGEAMFSINMSYDSEEERDEISNKLPEILGKSADSNGQDFTENLFGEAETIDYKKGFVIIPAQDIDDELGDQMGDEDMDLEDEETKMMMNMMFGDSEVKSIYHLPGPVEFTNDANAIINGSTVTFTVSFIELMEMKEIPKRVIKYKP